MYQCKTCTLKKKIFMWGGGAKEHVGLCMPQDVHREKMVTCKDQFSLYINWALEIKLRSLGLAEKNPYIH